MKFRTTIKHKPGTLLELASETIKLNPDSLDEKGLGFAEFETADIATIDRLLEIPEGFAVVDGVPPAAGAVDRVPETAPSEPDAEAKPAFILTDKDTGATLDLSTLDDAALKAFVKENGIKGVHHKVTGDKLRAAIVAATAG